MKGRKGGDSGEICGGKCRDVGEGGGERKSWGSTYVLLYGDTYILYREVFSIVARKMGSHYLVEYKKG